jgi:hypothetical protein
MYSHQILGFDEARMFAPVDVVGGGCGQTCQILLELFLAPAPLYQSVELNEGEVPQFGIGDA